MSKLKSKQVKQPGTLSWAQISREAPVDASFPGGSDGKEPACNAGDLGSIPELGRSPGGGHGNPPQYSCLENPQGQRSLVGYNPWSHKESDVTECLSPASVDAESQVGNAASALLWTLHKLHLSPLSLINFREPRFSRSQQKSGATKSS